jgi:Protein of unknown function (DUF992)
MHRPLSALAALAVVAAVAMPAPSMAKGRERTKVGTLTCDISGGIGLIVTSKKELTCTFTPSQPGKREVYTGSITKYGLALAGHYGGASAEATVGAGVGANVLVGGSNRTVTLQPISVQGQAGLNLAVGVAGLDLRAAR